MNSNMGYMHCNTNMMMQMMVQTNTAMHALTAAIGVTAMPEPGAASSSAAGMQPPTPEQPQPPRPFGTPPGWPDAPQSDGGTGDGMAPTTTTATTTTTT
eukprot:7827181-Pyramimonas_sp.AAC.1